MSSILPGYEYDIFVSYRQKDNKGERWVSEFVDALKTELDSTFKEEISVYFDINPHDGLLETHDVNDSLKEKLKCLVFIPIISQTYCDPGSFAWEHEFKAFLKQAARDRFGLKIKLTGGNVASRILPVKIHNLDPEDKSLLESEMGGVLRPIEFIYKSSGVNRPLKPNDSRTENLNHTYYRDQINKVANSVKEIITGFKIFDIQKIESPSEKVSSANLPEAVSAKNFKLRIAIWSFIIIGLLVSGYFLQSALFKTSHNPVDKSIAVLPFKNMSNDPEQEYFSNGMMEEILNHLFKIGGLKIPSGTSSMRFKGSQLSVREIARELGVSYVLEGNVSRSGDNVRIIVRLINGKNEQLLWTEDYKSAMTAVNLFEIQSDVAEHVADRMMVVINPEVKKRIEAIPTKNTEAYTLFLQTWTEYLQFDEAKSKLERAILLDSGYADAYAGLAYYWLNEGGVVGNLGREQILEKAEPLMKKAVQLNNNSVVVHSTMAILRLWYFWDFESVEKELTIFKQLNPSNSDLEYFISDYLLASGKFREALHFAENALDRNKKLDNWIDLGLAYYFNNQPDKSLKTIETANKLFPDHRWVKRTEIKILVGQEKFDKAIAQFESYSPDIDVNKLIPFLLGHMGIAYFRTGKKSHSGLFLNELIARSRKSVGGSPSFFAAAVYTSMGEKEKAMEFLEKAYTDHEVEMYWLKVEPLFRPLHGDPRFEDLLLKIGFK